MAPMHEKGLHDASLVDATSGAIQVIQSNPKSLDAVAESGQGEVDPLKDCLLPSWLHLGLALLDMHFDGLSPNDLEQRMSLTCGRSPGLWQRSSWAATADPGLQDRPPPHPASYVWRTPWYPLWPCSPAGTDTGRRIVPVHPCQNQHCDLHGDLSVKSFHRLPSVDPGHLRHPKTIVVDKGFRR
jgi:hypothetical protein